MDPARCLCLGHRRTGRLPLSKRSRDKGNAKRRKIAVLAVAGLTPESFEVFLRSSGIGEIEQEDPPSSKALWRAGEEEKENESPAFVVGAAKASVNNNTIAATPAAPAPAEPSAGP